MSASLSAYFNLNRLLLLLMANSNQTLSMSILFSVPGIDPVL